MDLSRRLRERRRQGSLEDALAHLQARLRGGELQPVERAARLIAALGAGELGWERLELAAYLGDPLAVTVVGLGPLVELASYVDPGSGAVNVILGDDPSWDDVGSWAQGLAHWGRRAVTWCLLGGTRAAVAEVAGQPPLPPEDPDDLYLDEDAVAEHVRVALDRAEAWLRADVGGRLRAELHWYQHPLVRAADDVVESCGGAPLERVLGSWVSELATVCALPRLLAGMRELAAPWALGTSSD